MINTPVKQVEEDETNLHPALQFLILAGVVVTALVSFTLLGIGVTYALYGDKTAGAMMTMDDTAPNFVTGLWIVQIVGTTIPLFAAAIFFAMVVVKNPQVYIKANFRVSWVFYLLVLALMFTSAPLIEYLSIVNLKIHLSQSMMDTEKLLSKVTALMMDMKTIWALLFNILVIGLLTAIAEEFLFRGCLQTIFMRWTKNVHAAVWITAIMFSAFHDEFSGFLPRLILGVLFGYAAAWSGSVWPAVWAHFINNATDVIVTYLEQHKTISSDFDKEQVFSNTAYIFSFIIVLFLLWIYHSIAQNKKPLPQ